MLSPPTVATLHWPRNSWSYLTLIGGLMEFEHLAFIMILHSILNSWGAVVKADFKHGQNNEALDLICSKQPPQLSILTYKQMILCILDN